MKYLNKKEREEAEATCDYAAILKEFVKTPDENEIRLWDTTDGALFEGHYLAEPQERGFWIYAIMDGCGQAVNLSDKNLVEACQAFNTILQTMKA